MLVLKCSGCGAALSFIKNAPELICSYCGTHQIPASNYSPAASSARGCVLSICGASEVFNPSDAEIRNAVNALNSSNQDAFLILGYVDDSNSYVQCAGDSQTGFDFEYQLRDIGNHFQATTPLSAAQVVEGFIGFRDGCSQWLRHHQWRRLTL